MKTTCKSFRRLLLLLIIMLGGTATTLAQEYFWVDHVNYTTNIYGASAYVVDFGTVSEITIPASVTYQLSNSTINPDVDGFKKGVKVSANMYVRKIIVKDGALYEGFKDCDLTPLKNLQTIEFEGIARELSGAKLPASLTKVYWGTVKDDAALYYDYLMDFKEAGVPLVSAKSKQNDDAGLSYYYNISNAYVVGVSGSATDIVVPAKLTTKTGATIPVYSFGAIDVEGGNTQVKSLTFEGSVATYADFSCFPNLENITFNGIKNVNNVCTLEGKLKKNTALKTITFKGTLPNLAGAATDYFASPGSIVAYVEESQNIEELKTRDVWKAFQDIRYIGSDEVTSSYTITVQTYHGRAMMPGIDGDITDATGPMTLTVEQGQSKNFFAYRDAGDYTVKHVYLDGVDIIGKMNAHQFDYGYCYYYTLQNITANHNLLVMGEADHAVFTQLGVNQTGEGSTTLIATRADGTTTETLSLPQTTPYGSLAVASADLKQVELRMQCVNQGRPTVYNGETLLTDEQVKLNTSGGYYYATLALKDLVSGNFTVSYPLSYEQQEGVVKTTIVVGELGLSGDVTYRSVATGETKNGSVAKNSTVEFYHKNTATVTITLPMYASWPLRVRENGVDVTSQVVANTAYNYTYTVQHADASATIVIDNGDDMKLSLTSNASDVVTMKYKDKNGTQKTKAFSAGVTDFALSSKTSSEQELIVTSELPFTLYCNGEDISTQYASSNANATNAAQTDYHFPASLLQFVDGETTKLVFMLSRTMPITISSNTKDARGVDIVTYEPGNEEATRRSWGSMAQAPEGSNVKLYFYRTSDEGTVKKLYINGVDRSSHISNPSSFYAGLEYNTDEGYYALDFYQLGKTYGFGSYEALDVRVLFQGENDLDVTKDNAVVTMVDESGDARATMTFNSGSATEEQTMRRGTKVFAMPKASGTDADFLEMELLMPDGYECKLMIDGVNYTPYVQSSSGVQVIGDQEFVRCTIRFDSSFNPDMRRKNTSWTINVRKQATGGYNWNVALLGTTRASLSFFDEDNANKEYNEDGREAFAYEDLTESGPLSIDPKAEGFDLAVEFMDEEAIESTYGWDMSQWEQDYALVVMADGQDISDRFQSNFEFGYYARGLDRSLLLAENWVIGFKRKNATDNFTWTAVQTGDRGGSNASIVIDGNISWTFDSENKPVTQTVADTQLSDGQTVVTVRVDAGYSFRAMFNETDLSTSFVKGDAENGQDVYTLTFVVKNTATQTSPQHTDGVWMFEFTNHNEPAATNVPTWTVIQTEGVTGAEVIVTRDGASKTTALTEPSTQVSIASAESATLKVPAEVALLYDVYLTGYGTQIIAVTKAVREVTGFGLKESSDLVHRVDSIGPQLLKAGVSDDEAQTIKQTIEAAGGTVELQVVGVDTGAGSPVRVLRDGVDVTATGEAADGYITFTVSASDLTSQTWVIFTESDLDRYDVNRDGHITIADVTKLVNKVLGK